MPILYSRCLLLSGSGYVICLYYKVRHMVNWIFFLNNKYILYNNIIVGVIGRDYMN